MSEEVSDKAKIERDVTWRFKRAERRVLVGWVKFARRYRNSTKLPFALFFLIFIDAFIVFIPSMLCMAAAITISPSRWLWYALIFGTATLSNNTVTYMLGRYIPSEWVTGSIEFFGLSHFWTMAEKFILEYGSTATFFGALFSAPTQMMTAIIGIADAQVAQSGGIPRGVWWSALALAFTGHFLKAVVLAAIVRFGWVRLEKRIEKKHQL